MSKSIMENWINTGENFIPEAPRNKNLNQVAGQADLICNMANKLRGAYMPDKYSDVTIPMPIMRRFEYSIADTKKEILDNYEKSNNLFARFLCKASGSQFYNMSYCTLERLRNDPSNRLKIRFSRMKTSRLAQRITMKMTPHLASTMMSTKRYLRA